MNYTVRKMPVFVVFLVCIFQHSVRMRENTKYGSVIVGEAVACTKKIHILGERVCIPLGGNAVRVLFMSSIGLHFG